MSKTTSVLVLLGVLGIGVSVGVCLQAAEPDSETLREQAKKAFQAGNFKDAYEGYRKVTLDPKADVKKVGDDLKQAILALQRLGRSDEIDAYREQVIEKHQENWRLLYAAAQTYFSGEHYGFIVAGEFYRGNKRGGGRYVSSYARDRVRGLQLMDQALELLQKEENAADADLGSFYLTFAHNILYGGGYNQAWRLQYLTDLSELPDYEEGYTIHGAGTQGAPVDEEGNPIFGHLDLPESYKAAKTDGQRWRWLLSQAAEVSAGRRLEARMQFANFLWQQYGVQTLAQYGWIGRGSDADEKRETGVFALRTLGEDETIARLATGVKRFKLPEEYNFIRVYQQIGKGEGSFAEQALQRLAEIFSNRRQYPKAADYWRQSIDRFGPGRNDFKKKQLSQIVDNWGQFDGLGVQPAGKKATVGYVFRNGKRVDFEAHAIKVEQLLADVKAYLKSNPQRLEWERLNISDIGYRLVQENQQKYVGEKVATFSEDLEPREEHLDKRVTITTPLDKAGAYLLVARMADGNTSRIVVWITDTVIARKQLEGKTLYFVADAVTGQPIARANVEFFGWQQKHVGNNRFQISTLNFAEFTDKNGLVTPSAKNLQNGYQWVAMARANGRFAFLGFSHVWYQPRHDAEYNESKVFVITDRPVYRPDQPVKFKFWIRKAQYDQKDVSQFAFQSFNVQINNPQGEEVFKKTFTTDAYGGFEGEYSLPPDATLGQYVIFIVNHSGVSGGGNFRVEEYKKPEFEVLVDAPTEPVMLGEKITAKIRAKYYFGAPVVNATVKYKVTRTRHDERWYPPHPWDWFYGPGYWWFAYDYVWYPGWNVWGCPRPHFWWFPPRHDPPEVVAEVEVPIGPDGTVDVTIDTALAKEVHGDDDHKYTITAEVTDESRRTIVGSGDVLAPRKPFKVFVWVDRGYYRTGDVIHAHMSAHTIDRQPVKGEGELILYRITYNEKGEPKEEAIEEWNLATNAEGRAHQQITAAEPGQYRLAYRLKDAKGRQIEGGYIFLIRGEGLDSEKFRFNDLELIPDQKEYKPGDKVRLMINTDHADSTVLLFVRPANGVYLPPTVIKLDGKSTVEEIAVVTKDMPNFFVEAMTVADGKLYTEMREIVVPPESRVLNVKVTPSSTEYKPGQQAKMKVQLTDATGEPFVGSLVMTIYDKSIEYISGGSNVPEIREFFWKWRRNHHPQTESSLATFSHNLLKPGETAMSFLGVFGSTVADELMFGRNGRGASDKQALRQNRGIAMPMAAAAPRRLNAASDARAVGGRFGAEMAKAQAGAFSAPGGGEQPEMVQPTIRKEFADTAYWNGNLTTGKDGTAEIELKMPEQLTGWKVKTWAMGHGTKVGQGEVEVVTSKNLLVRMQAPRFFVEKDEVVLSANVHNYLKTDKSVEVVLEFDGDHLQSITDPVQKIEVKAEGEKRVDWRVKVVSEGEAVIRMKALTDEESDAVEMRFPVYVHGMLKTESFTGVLRRDEQSGRVTVKVPADRREDESQLEVRWSPTLAGAMVDALPYLVESPYKTTEGTLNRFLPTVITQNILLSMKLDLKELRQKRTNLNPQEIGDDVERAKQWKRFDRNPVFDQEEVRRLVKEGVQTLTEMQLSDGGWGWFSGWGEHSSAHTTALVVHGLQVAKANDVAIVPGVLENGIAWLKRYQAEQVQKLKNAKTETRPYKKSADNIDALVYMVLAEADVAERDMLEFLYRDRTKLSVYAMALYGLALHKQGQQDKLKMILENISQYLVKDKENQTAYLKLPADNFWWFWYGSDVEANAFYLKLLSRTDPKSETAAGLVKYLLNNRKHATYWNSTRDTAFAIEALAEYFVASGESTPDLTVEIYFDGEKKKEVKITRENLFSFDNKFLVVGNGLEAGEHTIEFRKKGEGPLYWNAYLSYFTLEDFIAKAGLEIKVQRKYYKLIEADKTIRVAGDRGQVVDQRVDRYKREELPNLSTLESGDLVEIELEIDSKNDYEYLVFEDMKAAGFEPVDQRSGYNSNSLGAYMELRDERVAFFVRWLARGKHSVSYRMRAEIPGKFSALPAKGKGVYAPELKANSDEIKLLIEDPKPKELTRSGS